MKGKGWKKQPLINEYRAYSLYYSGTAAVC